MGANGTAIAGNWSAHLDGEADARATGARIRNGAAAATSARLPTRVPDLPLGPLR